MSKPLDFNITLREKDNGWQVILSYKDLSGKWRQKSKQGFPGQRAAKRYGDELLEQVKEQLQADKTTAAIPPELQDITLREFAPIVFHARKLEYNSIVSYTNALERFGDALLDMPVEQITYFDISTAMQSWTSFSVNTQKHSIACIKMLFKQAAEAYELRPDNPTKRLENPKETKKRKQRIHALTKSELDTLLDTLKKTDMTYYTICAIAGLAGLRYGEILGLLRTDFDAEKKTLSITKQFNRINKKTYALKSIKNSSNGYRTIPIPPTLVHALREYKQFAPLSIDNRLFPFRTSGTTTVNYKIHQISPNTSIHDLRHTYATLLLAHGENIKTVAALLGDDIKTVLETYIDYTDEMRQMASQSIEKIFA